MRVTKIKERKLSLFTQLVKNNTLMFQNEYQFWFPNSMTFPISYFYENPCFAWLGKPGMLLSFEPLIPPRWGNWILDTPTVEWSYPCWNYNAYQNIWKAEKPSETQEGSLAGTVVEQSGLVWPGNLEDGLAWSKTTNNLFSHSDVILLCPGKETNSQPHTLALPTRQHNESTWEVVQPIQQPCLQWHFNREHSLWLLPICGTKLVTPSCRWFNIHSHQIGVPNNDLWRPWGLSCAMPVQRN